MTITTTNELNSSNQSDQSSTLSVITRKLGHDLDEIRVRSLDHLESKLDNNLVSEDDLAVSRDLFVKLLELLNNSIASSSPSPAMCRQIARVLLKLMRWSSTSKTLLLLNGVDIIDKVKLETNDVSARQDLESVSQQLTEKLNQWSSGTGGSYSPPPPSQTSTSAADGGLFDQFFRLQLQTRHVMTLAGYNANSTNNSTTTASSENTILASSSQASSHHNQYVEGSSTREKFLDLTNSLDSASKVNLNKANENFDASNNHNSSKSLTETVYSNTSKSNRSHSSTIASSIFQKSLSVNNSSINNTSNRNIEYSNRGAKVNIQNSTLGKTNLTRTTNNENRHQTIYYWLPLTKEDKKFLETTENTLKSEEMEKIKRYCTFLQTNVFNDFPAEVFLQRSNILKALTNLTIKSYTSWQHNLEKATTTNNNQSGDYLCEETSLNKCLITCFHYYCSKLRKRIDYIKDPSTFCCKDFYSSGGLDFMSRSTQLSTSRSIGAHQNQTTSSSSTLKHVSTHHHHHQLNTSSNSIDSQNSALLSSIKSTVSTNTMASNRIVSAASMKHTNNKKVAAQSGKNVLTQKQQQQQKGAKKSTASLQIIVGGNNTDRRNVVSSDESESASVIASSDLVRVDETLISDLQASIDSLINETNIENYETDVHEKVMIQKSQEWPIHSFGFKLMATLIENLSLVIIKNNNFGATHLTISTSLVPIICETISLIVEILNETKLEWSCLNLNDVLTDLFQKFKRNLKFLYSRLNDEIVVNRNLNILNRMVYNYLVITFYKIVDLLQSLEETNVQMPNDLSETIFLILNDVCLLESFKPIERTMASLLATLDNGLYEIYSLSNEICESMRCACEFLMKYNSQNNLSQIELLESAKKSLNYMDYHLSIELTSKLIEFSSKICINLEDIDNNKFKSDVEYLVTSCMMSKNDEIRLEAYSKIYKLVNESLNIQVATEVNSKRYKGINFLLLNKIFYQFITFGLFDKSGKVRKVCENILQHLLLSELLIPETVRQKLTQLITIYMPFIQCFANLTDRLGQFILKMSDDLNVVIPSFTSKANSSGTASLKVADDGCKLFLSPAIERLRCSLRYLFFKEKNMRKKGYQQALCFLTKHQKNMTLNSTATNETSTTLNDGSTATNASFLDDDLSMTPLSKSPMPSFNLNDFLTKYSPEKYCDLVTRLKRTTRTFAQTNYSLNDGQQSVVPIFQTENLLKVYNIFTSDSIDIDLKKNASEQLMIMIGTGDEQLHRAFINLDGVNYFLRYLKNSIVGQNQKSRQHLFLCDIEKEKFDRIQANCISLLCHIFYWNHDIRQLYLFDIEIYRLIVKCLIICMRQEQIYIDQQQSISKTSSNNQNQLSAMDANIYSNSQEDLACLLFTLLFHQVSSLDYYHHQIDDINANMNKFDLSINLKSYIHVPFSMTSSNEIDSSTSANQQQLPVELKNLREQQLRAYELNYRLELLVRERLENNGVVADTEKNKQKSINARLRDLLDDKFRLYWNFKWHGGSMIKLCNDLLYNEAFVQTADNSLFDKKLCLTESNKLLTRFTNPVLTLKQLYNELNTCTTHATALNTLDLIQLVLAILIPSGLELSLSSETSLLNSDNDEYDRELYTKHSLSTYFDKSKCDWHLNLARFAGVVPSNRSQLDQMLFASSFRTLTRMIHVQMALVSCSTTTEIADLKDEDESVLIDKWLFDMVYSPASCLLHTMKGFLSAYENGPTEISLYLLPLCEFVETYFKRMSTYNQTSTSSVFEQFKLPSIELLKICMDQMHTCDVEKYRNLNKLSILMTLIASLLRVNPINGLFNNSSSESSAATSSILATNNSSHTRIYIRLIKSLIQIISILNDGRGGLSLSFMGNYVTKSAHTALLQLVKNAFVNSENQQKTDIVKAVLCLKDQKNKLIGSSWLIPLMLHREPQIRSTSFSLISLLINVPFARIRLMANQAGIWSIALNVLLNRFESSIVRTQAANFLINLTQSINTSLQAADDDYDDTNISASDLHYMLSEFNFYHQITLALTMFYPFDTYSFADLIRRDDFYGGPKLSTTSNSENTSLLEEASICSPLLVSSICQLLYNLAALNGVQSISMANDAGIVRLLVSYVKPTGLFSCSTVHSNSDLIDMLQMICRYFTFASQIDSNFASMLIEDQSSFLNDLIECLSITTDRARFSLLYAAIFELLTTFLLISATDDRLTSQNKCLFKISKFWPLLNSYLVDVLLEFDEDRNDDDIDEFDYSCVDDDSVSGVRQRRLLYSGLKFYATYFSKFTQLFSSSVADANFDVVRENIAMFFDQQQQQKEQGKVVDTFGARLCRKLIKLFDKYFYVDSNASMKTIIANLMKPLFSLSQSAKQVAVDSGLIESLIHQLSQKHSALNIKSLMQAKGPFKENQLTNDMSQILLILKYLMCNNIQIKEYLLRSFNEKNENLISIIHSFWCWAINEPGFMKATLSTLCTLTANNKLAINQMTTSNTIAQTINTVTENRLTLLVSSSSTSSLSSLQQQQQQSWSNTLIYSIIKLLQKSLIFNQRDKSTPLVQKYAFALLTNCARLSSECKNIVWKSNLMLEFTSIDVQSGMCAALKFNVRLERLWLTFVLGLSFVPDGQQFVLKCDGLLPTLIKIYEYYRQSAAALLTPQHVEVQYLCLLILRNLAFNPANKSKLISNSDYLNSILFSLRVKNEKFQLLALSALHSLLYDYQKVKAILKNTNALKYLAEIYDAYSKSKNSNHERIISITSNLIKILNEY